MPRVAALYRHPLKGFTPELRTQLTIQRDGRVLGDRVLAFRFAEAASPEERDGLDYWPKARGLSLQDFPALAALRLSYDEVTRRLDVSHAGSRIVEAGLDTEGRQHLVDAVTAFVLDSAQSTRLGRPGRLPLVLVGDGVHSRFQDRAQGYVSVHSEASVRALADALASDGGESLDIDSRRFRSNIVIEGLDAWDELAWQGRIRIGTLEFRAAAPIVRCLATHANPDTGERDARVLTTLTKSFGQQEPTLGRLLLPAALHEPMPAGTSLGTAVWGTVSVGDEVELLDE